MNRFDNHAWSILHRPANKGRLSWRPLSLRTRRTQYAFGIVFLEPGFRGIGILRLIADGM
jgi:hypothetical protein